MVINYYCGDRLAGRSMPFGVAIIGSLEVVAGLIIILMSFPLFFLPLRFNHYFIFIGLGSTIILIIGLIQLLIGIGFLSGSNFARIITIIFSIFDLFVFPIGTIIGIIMLIYLFSPGVVAYFKG